MGAQLDARLRSVEGVNLTIRRTRDAALRLLLPFTCATSSFVSGVGGRSIAAFAFNTTQPGCIRFANSRIWADRPYCRRNANAASIRRRWPVYRLRRTLP